MSLGHGRIAAVSSAPQLAEMQINGHLMRPKAPQGAGHSRARSLPPHMHQSRSENDLAAATGQATDRSTANALQQRTAGAATARELLSETVANFRAALPTMKMLPSSVAARVANALPSVPTAGELWTRFFERSGKPLQVYDRVNFAVWCEEMEQKRNRTRTQFLNT